LTTQSLSYLQTQKKYRVTLATFRNGRETCTGHAIKKIEDDNTRLMENHFKASIQGNY